MKVDDMTRATSLPSVARYAVYFAPAARSPWWQAGSRWLGRDACSGAFCAQPAIPGLPPGLQERLTASPRKYGLHATLKAPFHLAAGSTEQDLLSIAHDMAARESPISLAGMAVRPLRGFLALQLPPDAAAAKAVSALATRCVTAFDALRAPPGADELARRRRTPLTARHEELLARWGYPYTEEAFCLHMTLTDRLDRLDVAHAQAILQAARSLFAAIPRDHVLELDALTLFRQPAPGNPFTVWQRFACAAHLPSSGSNAD